MSLHKHRSKMVTDGVTRAPHRAFLRATGLDDEAMQKSFVGIVSTAGENTPCSMSLGPQAENAKLGVAAGGGVPIAFSTVSVSDGTSMNHAGMRMSLLSRELVADSIELVVRGHAYDALVGFAGCDKTLPGVMMGMVRVNVPSVFVYGGAMLPGTGTDGREITILDTIEAVGRFQAGAITAEEFSAIEHACSPTAGACPGQFTANTMAMVAEALGLSPLGSAMMPAVYSERIALARRAGETVMKILNAGARVAKTRVRRSRPPAVRPMPRCISRRSLTRPASASRSPT